jgi:hypothetical protein
MITVDPANDTPAEVQEYAGRGSIRLLESPDNRCPEAVLASIPVRLLASQL